jgi:hypothetical protein
MIDTMTDLRAGSVQPHELLHMVAQMKVMQDQAKDDLGELEQQLQNALDAKNSAAQ